MKRNSFLTSSIIFVFLLTGLLINDLAAQNASPTPPPDDDGQVITIDSRLVQVEAIVKDKKGNVIRDLTADDFELVEGGKTRLVEFFSYVSLAGQKTAQNSIEIIEESKGIKQEQVKRTMVFIVSVPDFKMTVLKNIPPVMQRSDESLVTVYSYKQYAARGLAMAGQFLTSFVEKQLTPNDLVSIVDTESNLGTLSNFTNDREQLLAAARQIEESLSQGKYSEYKTTVHVRGPRDVEIIAGDLIQQNLNTLKMAESAIEQLKKVPGQKLVFLISRGMLGARSLTGADVVTDRLKRVIEKANQNKVTFYSLGLKTLDVDIIEAPPPPGVYQSSDVMRQLAEKTGGRGIFNTNDIRAGFTKIMEENNGYYQLAFSPDEVGEAEAPRAYEVKIRLKRPGLTVQHRASVYQDNLVAENADPKQAVLKLLRTPFKSDRVKIKLATDYRVVNKKEGNITTVINIAPELLEPVMLEKGIREVKLKLGIQIIEPDNYLARQEVKDFSLKISEDSWRHIQKEGLVYQFETSTKKQGAYSVKVAACVNETSQCGNIEKLVNVK